MSVFWLVYYQVSAGFKEFVVPFARGYAPVPTLDQYVTQETIVGLEYTIGAS